MIDVKTEDDLQDAFNTLSKDSRLDYTFICKCCGKQNQNGNIVARVNGYSAKDRISS